MVGDHLDQVGRKAPAFSQQSSALAVREAQRSLFGLVQRNSPSFGNFKSSAEFLGQDPEVDDDSKVMQKACKICFPRISEMDGPCQMAADQGTTQRVLPKHDRIHAGVV